MRIEIGRWVPALDVCLLWIWELAPFDAGWRTRRASVAARRSELAQMCLEHAKFLKGLTRL